MEKLTEQRVKALQPPASGNRIEKDTSVRGFGVRVTAAGAKSYVLNYTVDGRERRMTIGPAGRAEAGGLSLAAAREKAALLRAGIRDGTDPLLEAQKRRDALTIRDLCDLYEREHLPTKRASSQKGDLLMIKVHILPALQRRRIADVTLSDVRALHRGLSDTLYMANRVLALLSKMFALAIQDGVATVNPCKGIKRNREDSRHRYLKPEELAKLATVLNARNDDAADAVKLLLLTGARRNEVLKAEWAQFDLANKLWTKPGSTTKQKTKHRVPLSAAAVELLQRRQDAASGSPFVFPGAKQGQPLSDLKRAWQAIRAAAGLEDNKAAGIEGVRLHDLRHTYASILVSAGLSLPIIGALLGHNNVATTQGYAHLMDEPLRNGTEAAAAAFKFAETGKTADIVKLPTKGVRK